MLKQNNRILINLLFAVFITLMMGLLSGCHPIKPFTDIESDDVVKLIHSEQNSGKLVIMDVRTPEEFNSGYIAGAVNIDFKSPEFAGQLDGLDKTKTYVVYCRSGGRSAKAMAMMKEKGFQKVYNLRGGITEWIAQKHPLYGK